MSFRSARRIPDQDGACCPRRPKNIFSQGAEWKALISKHIGTIPLSGEAARAAEQSTSGGPPPRTPVSSAMIAKVGAAARYSQSAAPIVAVLPSSQRIALQPRLPVRASLMFSLLQQSAEAALVASLAAALLARAIPASCSAVAFPKGGLAGVRYRNPFRVGRGTGDVTVVPVPPLVRPRLRVAVRRVFPLLLAPERRHVEVAPDGPHRLVAAAVDHVGAEDALAVADERVVAVPLIDAEVGVKTV